MLGKKLTGWLFAVVVLALAGCGSQESAPQKALPGDYDGPPGGAAKAGPPGATGSEGSPAPTQRAPQ